MGMEEGVFPGMRSFGDEEEIEEERRLCYVGITRAMKRLNLSCARMRMIRGETQYNPMSRFLKEIPKELLNEESATRAKVEDFGFTYTKKPTMDTLSKDALVGTVSNVPQGMVPARFRNTSRQA